MDDASSAAPPPPAQKDADLEDLEEVVARLEREKAQLRARLEFVEELVGPTEAQRKAFHEQLTAARGAALRAKRCGVAIPTRFVGRLDERWLRSRGVSERDCALLQRGCITGQDGVPRDISLLGDPAFRPYDQQSLQPRWEARGGSLRLRLADVRDRWGEEVALEVVRCAIELDRYDASRRIGVELPWSAAESRELQAAEVIHLMERELTAKVSRHAFCAEDLDSVASSDDDGVDGSDADGDDLEQGDTLSVVESVISAGGTITASSTPPAEDQGYEWSLADADIEQLLSSGAKGGAPRTLLATAAAQAAAVASPRSLASDEALEEEQALLELLEEEVAGSLSVLTPSPDI